jgi:c-di-GMP-binding flagellar brake protein YcgR
MNEKRKFIRILESAEISYRLISKLKLKGTLSKDISKGGLRFTVREFVPKDSTLKIKINLKKIPLSFETTGKVKWIRRMPAGERFEIGVEFVEITRSVLIHLDQYIKTLQVSKEVAKTEDSNNP